MMEEMREQQQGSKSNSNSVCVCVWEREIKEGAQGTGTSKRQDELTMEWSWLSWNEDTTHNKWV